MGEANLNLSEYSEEESKIFKIPLRKCFDPEAYIEVGLKATLVKEKKQETPKAGASTDKSDSAIQALM